MYAVFLDASKAFDRVQYYKLFNELVNRNISPLVLRLLLDMYTTITSKMGKCHVTAVYSM